jgi:DNA-binding transcriptional ArsR family regulator
MESIDRTSPRGTRAKVLADPLRVRILEVLSQRDMSPIEFCREGFAPEDLAIARVAEHFGALAENGSLAVVADNPGRGAEGRVYRAVARAFFSDLQWNELDREERVKVSATIVQGLLARIEGAQRSDTFDSRANRHLTWVAMRLDEQGWSEMATALGAAFGEVEQIRAEAEGRLEREGEEGIAATCGILGFPSPVGLQRTPPPAE